MIHWVSWSAHRSFTTVCGINDEIWHAPYVGENGTITAPYDRPDKVTCPICMDAAQGMLAILEYQDRSDWNAAAMVLYRSLRVIGYSPYMLQS